MIQELDILGGGRKIKQTRQNLGLRVGYTDWYLVRRTELKRRWLKLHRVIQSRSREWWGVREWDGGGGGVCVYGRES